MTGGVLAEPTNWDIDKAHSGVYFDIRHTFATVRGQFEDYSGTIQFDPQNLTVSTVSFEIKTKSVNTGIPNRDNHLRSDEFFAVKDFPDMTFQSTAVKPKGENQYALEGKLTIRGRTMDITAELIYFGTRENPLKKGQLVAGFEARFTLNRLEYGVGPGKYFEMGVIADKVDVLIAIEALRKK